MKLKVVNLGTEHSNVAVKILTENSDICIISDVNNLSTDCEKELYNSKWIVNCLTLDDYDKTFELAKRLRPKQLFIVDASNSIDEFSREEVKSWRGDIISDGSVLELTDKPDEGLFLNDAQWNSEDGTITSFNLDKRFRIEGREFILCTNDYAYGKLKIGTIVRNDDSTYRYNVKTFVPFTEKKLLTLKNNEAMFVENIDEYYFEKQLQLESDEQLLERFDSDADT